MCCSISCGARALRTSRRCATISRPSTRSAGGSASTRPALPPPKTGALVTNRSLTVPYAGQTSAGAAGLHRDAVRHRSRQPAPAARPAERRRAGRRAERRLRDAAARRRRAAGRVDRAPCRGPQRALRARLAGRRTAGRRPGRHLAGAARPGALRAGRPPGAAADQLPPTAQAGAGAYGASWSQEGRVRHRRPPEPADRDRPAGAARCLSGSARPAISASSRSRRRRSSASTPTARTRRPTPPAPAIRRRSPSIPQTGELWAVVQERDGLGDNLPSDLPDPRAAGRVLRLALRLYRQAPAARLRPAARPTRSRRRSRPTCCSRRIPRCSTWCSTRATSSRRQYRGSLFVALKGSWNRSVPTGYKIVRVPFKDGKPAGSLRELRRPASGPRASSAPRSGAARRRWRSPRTARCWSPTTPAARSGASPIPADGKRIYAMTPRCQS